MEKLKQIVNIVWLSIWSLPEVISAFIVSIITNIWYYQYKLRQVSVANDMLLSIPITITFLLLSLTSLIHMGIMKAKYLKDYRVTIEGYKNNLQ